MTALPHSMTVDEYLAWAEGRQGRFELHAGSVYAMSPERARHGEIKFGVQAALLAAIRRAGLPCHMLPDGITVRVGDTTAYEPDALVYCGPKLPPDTLEVPAPSSSSKFCPLRRAASTPRSSSRGISGWRA